MEVWSSKFANVNGDISNINQRIFQCNIEHDRLRDSIQKEGQLRQVIEKKTFLMNETFTEQIASLKTGINSLALTLQESIEEIKVKLFEDVKRSNSKFIQSIESNLIKSDEYNQHRQSVAVNEQVYSTEQEKKLSLLEEVIGDQLDTLRTEVKAEKEMNSQLKEKIEASSQTLNESIRGVNREITMIKNEMEMIKGFKLNSLETFGKIANDMLHSNEHISKCSNEVSLYILSTESKMNHFENVFKRLNESFNDIKSSISTQIDSTTKAYSMKNDNAHEELLQKIKENHSEIEKNSAFFMKEHQQFIEFNQTQMQFLSSSMKKLFNYSNDDIELLKKKTEGLESLQKTQRCEFISNLNQLEVLLIQRFNSILYPQPNNVHYN